MSSELILGGYDGEGAAPRSTEPYPVTVVPRPMTFPNHTDWNALTPVARLDLACHLWSEACERRHQHAPADHLTANQQAALSLVGMAVTDLRAAYPSGPDDDDEALS